MKLDLHNVTLITVNTLEPELSIAALEYSSMHINFAQKVLITSGYNKKHKGIHIVNIEAFDIVGYSRFMLRELYKYVHTDYCLVIQTDGFVLNRKHWKDEYLNYDYIGAPWPDNDEWIDEQPEAFKQKYRHNLAAGHGRVGNGGFSLRSKKLLHLTARCPFETQVHPEDNYFALYHIEWFIQQGVRFAPVSVALNFSLENVIREVPVDFENSFGFHGRLTPQHKNAIAMLTAKRNNLWQRGLNKIKALVKKVLDYRILYANAIKLNPPRIYSQPREFYFNVFKREYKLYHKWIDANVSSNLPIDIIIPAIDKDLHTLPYVVRAARKHVKHPIAGIYILAPNSPAIISCAKELQCHYVNEQDVCSITKSEIGFVINGINRSGWIYQQLLKLNLVKVGTCKHHLVLDADTIFVKDVSFEYKGKLYFDFSDEYHSPYYVAYEKLTGYKHAMPVSFVSHYMLFNKGMLENLKQHIYKQTGKSAEQAIIDLKSSVVDPSNFSEYETYANYCIKNAPKQYRLRYWFNKSCQLKDLDNLQQIINEGPWRSVSFHAYNH